MEELNVTVISESFMFFFRTLESSLLSSSLGNLIKHCCVDCVSNALGNEGWPVFLEQNQEGEA